MYIVILHVLIVKGIHKPYKYTYQKLDIKKQNGYNGFKAFKLQALKPVKQKIEKNKIE